VLFGSSLRINLLATHIHSWMDGSFSCNDLPFYCCTSPFIKWLPILLGKPWFMSIDLVDCSDWVANGLLGVVLFWKILFPWTLPRGWNLELAYHVHRFHLDGGFLKCCYKTQSSADNNFKLDDLVAPSTTTFDSFLSVGNLFS